MYPTVESFLKDWGRESLYTVKVFRNITDEALNLRFTERVRTVGFLAWHITATIGEMLTTAGYNIGVTKHNEKAPVTINEIISVYIDSSKKLVEEVKGWSKESLAEQVNMYGEMWSKEEVLIALVKHQIHHRGQLTVLMRMAGLKVPGMYGPSYEEWQQMNMQPME